LCPSEGAEKADAAVSEIALALFLLQHFLSACVSGLDKGCEACDLARKYQGRKVCATDF